MTASDLLEQPCNKSDNAIKLVTSCEQLVPNLLQQLGFIFITGLVCCCLCSFRKSRRRRRWVLVERVGFNDDEFLLPEQHDNRGMQMNDLQE